jgi:type I restriction enzyme S subunit
MHHLPEGWVLTSVAEVSTAIQYGFTTSATERTNGPRFLRITDIQDGGVDWKAVPSCDIDDEKISRFALARGDIVFARTGATTGKSFLIGECPSAIFASYLIRLRPGAEVLPEFLARYFQTPEYWRLISENVAGNAQPNCNASKLGALALPLAPADEQRRIVNKLEALLAGVNAARQRLAKVPAILKRFRQSVLAAACSGELTADWREEYRAADARAIASPGHESAGIIALPLAFGQVNSE